MFRVILVICGCFFQASTAVVAGIGIAIVGFGGRYILRTMPALSQKMAEALKTMPKLDSQVIVNHLRVYCRSNDVTRRI